MSMSLPEYMTVESSGLVSEDIKSVFDMEVNSLIAEGWDLQGGISISIYVMEGTSYIKYAHSMVKYPKAGGN